MQHFRAPLPFRQDRVQVSERRGLHGPVPSSPKLCDQCRGPAGLGLVCACARAGSVKKAGMQGSGGVARPRFSYTSFRLRSPFSRVAPYFDRYICLARYIRYGTIKPVTKYCPIFILSLASVQQDRNSGLTRNDGAAICEKSVQ